MPRTVKKDLRSRCMGRSRGGLTTKIHALVDAMGRPIVLKLTAGQAHDGRSAVDMFETLRAGNILLADRAYDSNALREWLADRGAWGNIRAMRHRLDPPAFSHWLYRQRNVVERLNSNISALSPRAMTSETTTISLPLNLPHCEYGSDIMSR